MTAENRRILIIDDERPILLTLEALLGRHGYHADTARTAAAGMRTLESKTPALVLLDLQLPDAEGLQMLDQIKRKHPEMQVIILTAHDSLNNAIVKLNCAAFPQTMIESELFGYVKGAFTGAMNDFRGMIAEAEGSTLFLDEISELPTDLQTRFLRVLQGGEYRSLGSTRMSKADFRVITATNRPIAQALAENRLRSDLYYRINTFQIEVPPLRERKEDIPPLVTFFVHRFAAQLGKAEPTIAPEAFQKLLDYSWPGNVRELQNAIEYGVVLARNDIIGIKELPTEIQLPPALQTSLAPVRRSGVASLDDMERETILQALTQTHGNKKKAAELLGIQRPTLYNKMKRYAIEI